jgi:hypothetical protein
MRSVAAAILLVVGFGCSAAADEKPLTELMAACDQVAANPFDNTRPVGVAGVGFAKIVPEAAISACEEAATAAPDDGRMAMQFGRAYLVAKNLDAARFNSSGRINRAMPRLQPISRTSMKGARRSL